MRDINNKKGFTLIEVIIAMAISGIVIAVVYGFLVYGSNVYTLGTKKADIQQSADLAAFTITKTLRNIKGISLTDKPGYTLFDIRSKSPGIDSAEYTIINNDDNFSLKYVIIKEGHVVESEILLNNVKSATIGAGYNNLWILSDEAAVALPSFAIGSASDILRSGKAGSITYSISTLNIPNNSTLSVSLVGPPIGLTITNNPSVINNSASITVSSTAAAAAGAYSFKVSYPGADDKIGTITVLDAINSYTVTFDKNGGTTEANPSLITVEEGLTVELPTVPTRSSHSFAAWNTKSDGTGTVFDDTTAVTNNITVYAKWNSGSPVVTTITVSGDTSIDIPNAPTQSINRSYTATVLDQYGSKMEGQTIIWSVSSYGEVSINQSGILTVGRKANKGTITITATVGSKTGVINVGLVELPK